MVARLIDGTSAAADVKNELRQRIRRLSQQGIVPGLGTVLVGHDPASRSDVTGKHRDCDEVGVASASIELPATASFAEIRDAITQLNTNPAVTGFIVQLPLPADIETRAVLQLVDASKDADGLHPTNLGHLVLDIETKADSDSPLPCTPLAIVELLQRNEIELAGRRVVVIGRGVTVGRPLSLLLNRKGADATVTVVHSRTPDLAHEVRRADIVVAAVGLPHFVQPEWVKPGAAVIEVGVTRVGTTSAGRARLAGDVDPRVAEVAGWLSPNPGGVGPMTRAMLVANVVAIAERAAASVAA